MKNELHDLWQGIHAQPRTSILTKEEFALSNHPRHHRSNHNVAQNALISFWHQHQRAFPPADRAKFSVIATSNPSKAPPLGFSGPERTLDLLARQPTRSLSGLNSLYSAGFHNLVQITVDNKALPMQPTTQRRPYGHFLHRFCG